MPQRFQFNVGKRTYFVHREGSMVIVERNRSELPLGTLILFKELFCSFEQGYPDEHDLVMETAQAVIDREDPVTNDTGGNQ